MKRLLTANNDTIEDKVIAVSDKISELIFQYDFFVDGGSRTGWINDNKYLISMGVDYDFPNDFYDIFVFKGLTKDFIDKIKNCSSEDVTVKIELLDDSGFIVDIYNVK